MKKNKFYFVRLSGFAFIRIRLIRPRIGRLVLPTSPMISAPICMKHIMTQITTKVTQLASYMATED